MQESIQSVSDKDLYVKASHTDISYDIWPHRTVDMAQIMLYYLRYYLHFSLCIPDTRAWSKYFSAL